MTALAATGKQDSTLIFLSLTALAAGGFFAASTSAYVTLPLAEFATISATLALSTVLGALLQCGAAYALPFAARQGGTHLDATFQRLLCASILLGSILCLLALLVPRIEAVRFGFILGAATGIQLVCDSYLRSRAEVLLLAKLNAALHLGLLVCILTLILQDALTIFRFIACVTAVKLAFGVFVLHRFPPALANWKRPGIKLLGNGIKAQAAFGTVIAFGTLDVLILETLVQGGADYIALRHFSYGLFLAIVQESALPLLTARLVKPDAPKPRRIFALATSLAICVGAAAAFLTFGLAALRPDAAPDWGVVGCIVVSLMAHSLLVISCHTRFATSAIGGHLLQVAFAALATVLLVCWLVPAPPVIFVVCCVASANLLFAAVAFGSYAASIKKGLQEK